MDELNRLAASLFQWLTPRHTLELMLGIAVIWMMVLYLRRRHTFLSILIGAGSGIGTLLLCHTFGAAWGFSPPLTLYTLGISALGGIPAVLLLYGLHYVTA